MLYNAIYDVNNVFSPLATRNQKGVCYITTSMQDIEDDPRFSSLYSEMSSRGLVVNNVGMAFDRNNRNVLKTAQFKNALERVAREGVDIDRGLYQILGFEFKCTDKVKSKDFIDALDLLVYNLNSMYSDISLLANIVAQVMSVLLVFRDNIVDKTESDKRTLFYIGLLNREWAMSLHILSYLGFDIVYVNNFVNDSEFRYSWIRKPSITFKASNTLSAVNTDNYNYKQEVHNMLSQNDTTGVFSSNDTVVNVEVKTLRPTKDEYNILWNSINPARPGFVSNNGSMTISNLFGVNWGMPLNWVKSEDFGEYNDLIMEKVSDAAFVWLPRKQTYDYSVSPDLANFKSGLSRLLKRGGVTVNDLSSVNYLTNLVRMNSVMRNFVLSKINAILDELPTRSEKLDFLFSLGCLPSEFYNVVSNYEFNKFPPKVVGIALNRTFDKLDCLFFKFFNQLGFDILIFTPTNRSVFNNDVFNNLYESYSIGKSVIIETSDLGSKKFKASKIFGGVKSNSIICNFDDAGTIIRRTFEDINSFEDLA